MACPRCGSDRSPRPSMLYLWSGAASAWILFAFIANVTAAPGYWQYFQQVAYWVQMFFASGDTLFAIFFTMDRWVSQDVTHATRSVD